MKDYDMKDDYLWDRSGEPDPEIQQLEEILGTLRYQPQPLEIPQHIQPGRRRSFFPAALAIAAAMVLFAILVGLWFSFNRRPPPMLKASSDSNISRPAKPMTPPVNYDDQAAIPAIVKSPKQTGIQKHPSAPRILLTRSRARNVTRQPQLTPEELAEKEQVLVALRLVSAKLNLAQRKTQGMPQLNPVRNQHKIG